MSSAWGKSWGKSWGNAWGGHSANQPIDWPGRSGRARKRKALIAATTRPVRPAIPTPGHPDPTRRKRKKRRQEDDALLACTALAALV